MLLRPLGWRRQSWVPQVLWSVLAMIITVLSPTQTWAQAVTPYTQPRWPSASNATIDNGAALYAWQVGLADHRSRLELGRSVWNGPYSGTEGPHFALRFSPWWQTGSLLSGAWFSGIGDEDLPELPGTEPGTGGDRDDPKRGFLRWRLGKDGDSVHAELGLLQTTLGHGSAVNMYQNAPEGSPLAFGLALEGQLNGGGLVLVLGDFVHPGRFLAGRLRLKPFNIFLSPDSALEPDGLNMDPRGEVLGMFIIGFTAATDLEAPISADAIGDDGLQVDGVGARPMSAFGVDIEVPPIDMGIFHLNPYVDGVMLMGRGDGPGYGVHPGLGLGTDFWGIFWELAFQYYLGTKGYKPWYFDSRYVFERLRQVGSLSPKAAMAAAAPATHGYIGSASFQLVDTVTGWVELGDRIPFDSADGFNSGRLRVGATAGPSMANVTLSFVREGWRDYGRIGSDDGMTALIVQGKVSLLVLSLIARYTYSVEHDLDSDARFSQDDFAVGVEYGFSL